MRVSFYKVYNGYGDHDGIFVKTGENDTFIIRIHRTVVDDVVKWLNEAYALGVSEGKRAVYQRVIEEVEALENADAANRHKLFNSRR